jgi:hypothetical protein
MLAPRISATTTASLTAQCSPSMKLSTWSTCSPSTRTTKRTRSRANAFEYGGFHRAQMTYVSASGRMHGRRVDRDDEVEVREDRRGVAEVANLRTERVESSVYDPHDRRSSSRPFCSPTTSGGNARCAALRAPRALRRLRTERTTPSVPDRTGSVIPFVDNSRMRTPSELNMVVSVLEQTVPGGPCREDRAAAGNGPTSFG